MGMEGTGKFMGSATTDAVSPRRRQMDENRRKSLGAPMSKSVMTKAISGNSLSNSQQDVSYADKRATLAVPLTSVPGVGPNCEDDGKKKKGIFAALKKKKNLKGATQY